MRVSQRRVDVFHFFKVGNGRSQGQCAAQFNVYISGFPVDEVWLKGSRQAERVVHIESVDTAHFTKFVKMVICHAFYTLRDGMTARSKRSKLLTAHAGMVGDI